MCDSPALLSLHPQSAQGIQELLNVAKQHIPYDFWKATPLVLKATAGLRLLPGEKAQKLLQKVSLAIVCTGGWLRLTENTNPAGHDGAYLSAQHLGSQQDSLKPEATLGYRVVQAPAFQLVSNRQDIEVS